MLIGDSRRNSSERKVKVAGLVQGQGQGLALLQGGQGQLDRFLLRISVGYPSREQELQVIEDHRSGNPLQEVSSVVDGQQLLTICRSSDTVEINQSLLIQEFLS